MKAILDFSILDFGLGIMHSEFQFDPKSAFQNPQSPLECFRIMEG